MENFQLTLTYMYINWRFNMSRSNLRDSSSWASYQWHSCQCGREFGFTKILDHAHFWVALLTIFTTTPKFQLPYLLNLEIHYARRLKRSSIPRLCLCHIPIYGCTCIRYSGTSCTRLSLKCSTFHSFPVIRWSLQGGSRGGKYRHTPYNPSME